MISDCGPVVVKVGGSLFDLPDLGPRLRRWLDDASLTHPLLVPGGGATADVVRAWDRVAALGEEAAHWLALRALGLNAYFLAAILSRASVVDGLPACATVWSRGDLAILDPFAFASSDEVQPDHLPHTWAVTSDSVAARVAVVAEARQLVLLKSSFFPEPIDWQDASRQGFVDAHFPLVLQGARFEVQSVNLRAGQP